MTEGEKMIWAAAFSVAFDSEYCVTSSQCAEKAFDAVTAARHLYNNSRAGEYSSAARATLRAMLDDEKPEA